MSTIDPLFADKLRKYGADDFNACFNCGNCTAVCQHTGKTANFPRMMVRYGTLGLKDEILGSRELWLCYACGDCTDTCPRQADPGHYMGALRRYAIAHYEPTGITRLLFTSNPFAVVLTLVLASILGMFLFTLKPDHEVARWLFAWMPFAVIHNIGMVIFGFTGFAAAVGIFNMIRHLSSQTEKQTGKKNTVIRALTEVATEVGTMKRYQACDQEEDGFWSGKKSWQRPWFVHWSIMWGFLGLFLATVLDFLLKDPATTIWWPSRILGTISGLLMLYGSSLAIWYRINKVTKMYSETRFSDWTFLLFLWIAGFTGFWLETAVAFSADLSLNHIIFVVHTIVSMELVLLFAFSKFAHAFYRPLALFYYYKNNG